MFRATFGSYSDKVINYDHWGVSVSALPEDLQNPCHLNCTTLNTFQGLKCLKRFALMLRESSRKPDWSLIWLLVHFSRSHILHLWQSFAADLLSKPETNLRNWLPVSYSHLEIRVFFLQWPQEMVLSDGHQVTLATSLRAGNRSLLLPWSHTSTCGRMVNQTDFAVLFSSICHRKTHTHTHTCPNNYSDKMLPQPFVLEKVGGTELP